MRIIRVTIITVLVCFALASCKMLSANDNPPHCSKTSITYNTSIKPIEKNILIANSSESIAAAETVYSSPSCQSFPSEDHRTYLEEKFDDLFLKLNELSNHLQLKAYLLKQGILDIQNEISSQEDSKNESKENLNQVSDILLIVFMLIILLTMLAENFIWLEKINYWPKSIKKWISKFDIFCFKTLIILSICFFVYWLNLGFDRLNPSNFISIILAMLPIFIPLIIQKSKLDRMIMNDQVLQSKKIFILAIANIMILSFASNDTLDIIKIFMCITTLYTIHFYFQSFKRLLMFSEQGAREFLKPFFEKLTVQDKGNQKENNKIYHAWQSFWSENSSYKETPDILNIFISHIDKSIEYKEFHLAVDLADLYANNLSKREPWLLNQTMLPKVLEWNEKLWFEDQKKYTRSQNFGNWHYFNNIFFPRIVRIALINEMYIYFLMDFEKYVVQFLQKLNKFENDDEIRIKHERCLYTIFEKFFDELSKQETLFNNYKDYIPKAWIVIKENESEEIPQNILNIFIEWVRPRFGLNNLTNMMNVMFQNVDPELFTSFLMMSFIGSTEVLRSDIKPNFYIHAEPFVWVGHYDKNEDDKRKHQRKLDTIDLILTFFSRHWRVLQVDSSNKEEWDNADESDRKTMLKEAQIDNLKKIKLELESDAIEELCKASEEKTYRREGFIELLNLLIDKIEKS